MASRELSIKIRAEFEAASSELSLALGEIQSKAEELTDEFKQMGSAGSKALDTIGLGAETQLTRMQKFSNAFQGATGRVGSGIKAIDGFAKALGPWNQALELGGKVVNFASAGLDSYAKTSAKAAVEVKALTDEFTAYKSAVMETVGVVTVELLKPIGSIDKLRDSMLTVERTDFFKRFLTGVSNGRGGLGSAFTAGDDEFGAAGRSAVSGFSGILGGFTDAIRQEYGVDKWNTEGRRVVDDVIEGFKEANAEAKRIGKEQAELAKELAGQRSARALLRTATSPGGNVDVAGRPIGFSTQGLGASADSVLRDSFGRNGERAVLDDIEKRRTTKLTEDWHARRADFQAERSSDKSFLEAAFGSIDEINAHDMALKGLQITFGGVTTAVNSSMQAWISGSMSLGLAIKKGIGDALAGVASQMAIESVKHGLFALGSLAFLDFGGAARHGAAAAGFGAGAVAAAAAARKLGASVNAEVSAQRETAASAKAEETKTSRENERQGNRGLSSDGGGQVVNNYVIHGEHFYSESTRMRQLDAERFVKAAVGDSFVEHS